MLQNGTDRKLCRKMRAAYDQIAPQFAALNAAMPEALVTAAGRFVEMVGPGARVLDLGCGAGRDMAWLEARGFIVVGADLSAGMLDQARPLARGALVQMDMRHLALQVGCFQGVWCNAALLHLPKGEAPGVFSEISRVLVPNGVLFLSLQEGAGEGWEPSPYGGAGLRFFARYGLQEALALLAGSGFILLERSTNQAGTRRWLNVFARSSRGTE